MNESVDKLKKNNDLISAKISNDDNNDENIIDAIFDREFTDDIDFRLKATTNLRLNKNVNDIEPSDCLKNGIK
jgi:hypothetical protein